MSVQPTIAILGGGVAGMSCALWLKNLGFKPIILEKNTCLGGQLTTLPTINRWVLGFSEHTSQQLADAYTKHIQSTDISVYYSYQLLAIQQNSHGFQLVIQKNTLSCETFSIKALIIATGARPVGYEVIENIEGFTPELISNRVFFLPTDHLEQLPHLSTKTIAILGGGDNAHYTAKDIATRADKIHLIMRSSAIAQTLIRNDIITLIQENKLIEHSHSTITSMYAEQNKIGLALTQSPSLRQTLSVDKIFIRCGFKANTEFLQNSELLKRVATNQNYILTDHVKRTNIPGIYAIGDVTNSNDPSVVNALAEGALAARDLSQHLN